jgi:hypothetical protein
MGLTVLTDASTAQDSRTLTWTIPSLAIGDVVVVKATTWDSANTQNPPAATGLSFTQQVNVSAATRTRVYIWTAVASSGGSNVVVTSSVLAGGASFHTGALTQCPTADGYSLAGSPNVASTTGASGAPSVALAGASGNLGIVAIGDWDGLSGSGRAWLASATEDMYAFDSGINTHYVGHATLTGASTTLGLSAPTMTRWTIGAIEVLKSAGPAATRVPLIRRNRVPIIRGAHF